MKHLDQISSVGGTIFASQPKTLMVWAPRNQSSVIGAVAFDMLKITSKKRSPRNTLAIHRSSSTSVRKPRSWKKARILG